MVKEVVSLKEVRTSVSMCINLCTFECTCVYAILTNNFINPNKSIDNFHCRFCIIINSM